MRETPKLIQAEGLKEWERWHVEGRKGEGSLITTPDNRQFHLTASERFIIEPSVPEGDKMPEAFIEKNGIKIPFEKWVSQMPRD